jgi:hypothetical protein
LISSTNSCTTTNGTSCRRIGQLREDWPNLFGLVKPPLIPLNSFLYNIGLCNSTPNSPKFWSLKLKQIKKSKTFDAPSPCNPLIKFAYSLFLAKIYITCEQIIIGTPCYLSNWGMWYSRMKKNLALSCEELGIYFIKSKFK